MSYPESPHMDQDQEEQRMRSFLERYLVTRSATFTNPVEDGVKALHDGKSLYKYAESLARADRIARNQEYRETNKSMQATAGSDMGGF